MEKKNGSFSKVRKLITVQKKCNGKAIVGDSEALISPVAAKILMYVGLAVVGVLLFIGAFMLEPYTESYISVNGLAKSLMVAMFIMSFVLSIKDTVTVLYTSVDLELLLPMPFTAEQIAAAKIAVVCGFPVGLSIFILNSICLGYGIRAGACVLYVIGIVLSSVLLPVTGISLAVLLIVVIFRLFGFVRNRDIIMAVGGICAFGLTIAYVFLTNGLNKGDGSSQATAMLGFMAAVADAFPNISFMNRFMFDGSILGLVVSLVITAVIGLLASLAVKAFYFDTALSMRTTSVKRKAVSAESLGGEKKRNLLGALTGYEAKSARRNPAYMIYGFVMSFAWPVLMFVPLFLGNRSMFTDAAGSLGSGAALLTSVSFAIMASCFSCGFNILPGSAFSREGGTFSAIRTLPVSFTDYVKSKRNFSMIICSLGSVLYVVILGIVAVAMGFFSIASSWTILVGACVCFFMNLILVDRMLLRDSGKLRLNWDSETEFSRKLGMINIIAIIFGVVMLVVFMIAMLILPGITDPGFMGFTLILAIVIALVVLVAALLVDRSAIRKAAENLAAHEA